METARRGNYDSGEDFVLEYGELRFTFNERDFSERCEQAALKLGFVGGRLGEEELEDLVNLAVNGEILDPGLGAGRARQRLLARAGRARPSARSCTGCAASSSAAPGWTSASRRASWTSPSTRRPAASPTCSPHRSSSGEPIELAPEPSWGRVAYRR